MNREPKSLLGVDFPADEKKPLLDFEAAAVVEPNFDVDDIWSGFGMGFASESESSNPISSTSLELERLKIEL